jgi:malate permease and related proteins
LPSYLDLLGIVAPVFLMLATGWALRRAGWMQPEADPTLLKLGVYVLYPCLIAETILGNPALAQLQNVAVPAAAGCGTVLLGLGIGALAARILHLPWPQPARTFAFTTGLFNYGFIPIPLIAAMFPGERATLGTLFTYALGVECTLWSAGIAILAGHRDAAWWRSALNPPVAAIVVSLVLNAVHAPVPKFLHTSMQWLGVCAFPIQLVLTGAALADLIRRGWQQGLLRAIVGGNIVRLVVLPALMLAAAGCFANSLELRRIMIIQAAMPCAMLPVVLAKHYGGDSDLAAWVVTTTTALGFFTIPLWLSVGFAWVR